MLHPSRTISIVDDEESVRKALRRLIKAAGFEVDTFSSGSAFLTSLQTRQPDCVVLDLHLPEFSGLEVQERLRHEKMSLPTIMITGRDDPGMSERVLAAGAKAYLTKPLDEQTLLAAIANAICMNRMATTEQSETMATRPI